MPDEPKPKETSEEDGKNTTGKGADADTDTAKNQVTLKFTQEDQDKLAAKIRKEEKEKYDRKVAEAARLAEEARAAEQGEFQKLAEQRQTELNELRPQLEAATSELSTYRAKVSEMVAEELKALPDEVREAAPAQYAEDVLTNPLDVIAWLPKGKKLAEKLIEQTAKPSFGRDPKPNGNLGDVESAKRAAAENRRAYRY